MRFLFILLVSFSVPLIAQNAQPVSAMSRLGDLPKIAPLPPSGIVSIETLRQDFTTDPTAARQKYENKRIKVLGIVSIIESGSADVPLIVTLMDPAKSEACVKAEFLLGSLPTHSDLEINVDGASAVLLNRKKDKKTKATFERSIFIKKNQQLAVEGCYKIINSGDVVLSDCTKLKGNLKKIKKGIQEDIEQRELFSNTYPSTATATQTASPGVVANSNSNTPVSPAVTPTKQTVSTNELQLDTKLPGTSWTWEKDSKIVGKITFMPEGKAKYTSFKHNKQWTRKWKSVGKFQLELTIDHKSFPFQFNSTLTEFSGTDQIGYFITGHLKPSGN